MKIKPFWYGVLLVVVFMGTIMAFQSAGIWSVTGKTGSGGEKVSPSATDVNSIKGWMTLQEISEVYSVPLEEIIAEFDLPTDTLPETAIKDLENETFSVSELRTWLSER